MSKLFEIVSWKCDSESNEKLNTITKIKSSPF